MNWNKKIVRVETKKSTAHKNLLLAETFSLFFSAEKKIVIDEKQVENKQDRTVKEKIMWIWGVKLIYTFAVDVTVNCVLFHQKLFLSQLTPAQTLFDTLLINANGNEKKYNINVNTWQMSLNRAQFNLSAEKNYNVFFPSYSMWQLQTHNSMFTTQHVDCWCMNVEWKISFAKIKFVFVRHNSIFNVFFSVE